MHCNVAYVSASEQRGESRVRVGILRVILRARIEVYQVATFLRCSQVSLFATPVLLNHLKLYTTIKYKS